MVRGGLWRVHRGFWVIAKFCAFAGGSSFRGCNGYGQRGHARDAGATEHRGRNAWARECGGDDVYWRFERAGVIRIGNHGGMFWNRAGGGAGRRGRLADYGIVGVEISGAAQGGAAASFGDGGAVRVAVGMRRPLRLPHARERMRKADGAQYRTSVSAYPGLPSPQRTQNRHAFGAPVPRWANFCRPLPGLEPARSSAGSIVIWPQSVREDITGQYGRVAQRATTPG